MRNFLLLLGVVTLFTLYCTKDTLPPPPHPLEYDRHFTITPTAYNGKQIIALVFRTQYLDTLVDYAVQFDSLTFTADQYEFKLVRFAGKAYEVLEPLPTPTLIKGQIYQCRVK
jgi:hypothetical protein